MNRGFAGGSSGKESVCNAEDQSLIPGKLLWRWKWQPAPVFLPGEFHGISVLNALNGFSLLILIVTL